MTKQQIASDLRRLAGEGYPFRVRSVDDKSSLEHSGSQSLERVLATIAEQLEKDQ